ncbi:hypothetical protein [Halococcoides cellulosivorans]|uniref:Glutamate--cysteine ligase n=1 Tax=Halococcoides cellulosivorans TaxID=1679096 RepID=A0A2R4X2J2_9EURY|nr:hypothetical protein [Halococcoides cellulosivorans]AWB28017.1 hypothetical protein HARCEL1_10000 [Halococcoides cellulosivorans]
MSATDLAAAVEEALATDREAVREQATQEAEDLLAAIREGAFDNSQALVGLELELYAVDARTDALCRVPRQLLGLIGFEQELGLHNVETQTTPQPLNTHGLAAQKRELQATLESAIERTLTEDIRLVSDGVWTVPPVGEDARSYLTDAVEADGVTIGANMSDSVRYHAMANTDYPAGLSIDAPNVTLDAETVMPESLITSIQPHYQVARASALPQHFRYALRVAGPLLALGVNAPFFPPGLYDDAPADRILDEAHMSHRIGIFESVLNDPDGPGKVRFPDDVETVEDAVRAVVEDPTIVPMDPPRGTRFDDQFATIRHKHGSYWRWVRPVFDGASRSSANARIEFRPLGAQPTLHDAVAFEAVFAGLMESLPQLEHPVGTLDWAAAHENFRAAARDGLQAEMTWIASDGSETTATDRIYADLFEHARDGLERRGLTTDEARQYLRPLRERADRRLTPARWKHTQVCERVAEGVPLGEAIWGMQSAYIDRQSETLVDGQFVDWV